MLRRSLVLLTFVLCSAPLLAQESASSFIARANRFAAEKQFAQAEDAARQAVRIAPHSRDARITLANVLLWEQKYTEAGALYAGLVRDNPRDTDARLGLANSEYWSGDYRHASREYRNVLSQQPSNASAKRSLAEIDAASRPGFALGMSYLNDDQPYDATHGFIRIFGFVDPLTTYGVEAGDARYHSGPLSEMTPYIRGDVKTALVPSRLDLRGSLELLTFPDQTSGVLPGIAADLSTSSGTWTLAGERRALLRSVGALVTHPSADVADLRWARGETLAVHAEHLNYFDDNSGNGVDGWALAPLGRVRLGASAAWRDTAESRFVNGAYTPYYTPQGQTEARAIFAMPVKFTHSSLDLHVDGGVGRDDVAGTFYPWRANLRWTIPLPPTGSFDVEIEHNSTAFYSANEIRAGLAGRF